VWKSSCRYPLAVSRVHYGMKRPTQIRDLQRDLAMTTSGIRTIIADDEPLAREKLRILLASEAGVQIVAECRDGRQTIAALETHKPDLLLLDVQMPQMDGFEVLNAIPADDHRLRSIRGSGV